MIAEVKQPMEEEINERQRRFQLYDYYGIPYCTFDVEISDSIQKDWVTAMTLINSNKEIPKDLEKRLLKYKESR